MDGDWATVAVDMNGTVVGHFEQAALLPSSNGTWLNDSEILMMTEQFDLVAVDLAQHATRVLRNLIRPVEAVVDNRFVQRTDLVPNQPARLITSNIDGADPQPFITFDPLCEVRPFDVASP
jgi:hypothetical protein